MATDFEEYTAETQESIRVLLVAMKSKIKDVKECREIEENIDDQLYVKMCLVSVCIDCITMKFNRLKIGEVYNEETKVVEGENWMPYYSVMMYPFFTSEEIVPGHANPYFRGAPDDYNMNNFKDEVKGCIDNYLRGIIGICDFLGFKI